MVVSIVSLTLIVSEKHAKWTSVTGRIHQGCDGWAPNNPLVLVSWDKEVVVKIGLDIRPDMGLVAEWVKCFEGYLRTFRAQLLSDDSRYIE